MAYIPAVNVARVSVEMQLAGQTVVITLHFHKDGGWSVEGLGDLGAAIILWWIDHLAAIIANDVSLLGARATDLTTASSPSVYMTPESSATGARTSPVVALNVASVVTMRTPLRGRSYRGRNYIPGLTVDELIDAGYINEPTQSAIIGAYADLAEVEDALTCDHVVLSYRTGNAPRAAAVPTVITSYTCDSPLDSQRRRLPGRGS